MIIETDRLIIREFTLDDWEQVHVYASDADFVQFVEWGPNSEDATKDFINRMIMFQKQSPRVTYEFAIVLKDIGSVIGGCGLHVEEHLQAELGYSLNRQFWGNGFATEAAFALCRFGFKELKLHRIFATCRPENPASWRVMEKIGMTREGLLREHMFWKDKWQSSLVYSILVREFV
jgi:[ribosomal protein S5]-alanine N-acetyltransferase